MIDLMLKRNWAKCNRTRQFYLAKYKDWLNLPTQLPPRVTALIAKKTEENVSVGRPRKPFGECSRKSKKRRISDLLEVYRPEELQFAATESEKRSSDQTISVPRVTHLPAEQALALYLDLDLSERKYKLLRSVINSLHNDCFPSWYVINKTKKTFLPSKITTSEISAVVQLQDLLDKTVDSIVKVIEPILNQPSLPASAKLVCKWGFDGSGGHSAYKQAFTDAKSSDEYLFVIGCVPLMLVDMETGINLWTNGKPGSTLFCRPVELIFEKETASLVLKKHAEMKEKIKNLVKHQVILRTHSFDVYYELHLTMVDGKICQILTETTASSRCFVCNAKPTEMNTLVEKVPNKDNFKFGISSLHMWIRAFECLIHIAYRIPIKSWQVKGPENKKIFEEEKLRIQNEFKAKLGLAIDKPKQGFGSSNDGNTARRFFANPEVSAEITNIDLNLIKNFSFILRVISSGMFIHSDKFNILLEETKKLYLSQYNWFYMPSSIHKLLVHGKDIVDNFDIPIGQLSEDALEASHKMFRRNRLKHTRKSSRSHTCLDLMNYMLISSDPYISSKRNVVSKTRPKFDDDIKEYLIDMPTLGENEMQDINDLIHNLSLESSDSDDSD